MTIDNVLLIIIDQLRADYSKYMPKCANLLPYHAVCDTNSIPTSTEAMHANISTGLYPKDHGFISKNTKNGADGLDQILAKLESSELSSIASLAEQSGFQTYILGGKPETVKVMGQDTECDLRVYGSKLDVDGENKSLVKLVKDYKDPINIDFSEYEGIANALFDIYKLIKKESGKFTIFTLPESDILGHEYGPHSQELINHLKSLDDNLSEIIRELSVDSLVIIMGDHGCRNVDSYLIEYDEGDLRKMMLYDKIDDSFVCSGDYILDDYKAIQYDGGMMRIWFNEGQSSLSERDEVFLSAYGKIIYSGDDLDGTLRKIYNNSKHENIGDAVILANDDMIFCKRSWIKKEPLQLIKEMRRLSSPHLPVGEHGSYHKEDRLVLLMSNNRNFDNLYLKNIEIKDMINDLLS